MAITDRADPAASDPEATSVFDLRDNDGWNLVDLTHALSPSSLYWPNGEPFEHERQG